MFETIAFGANVFDFDALFGEGGDGGVGLAELFEDAATGGVGEGAEGGVQEEERGERDHHLGHDERRIDEGVEQEAA